jgi:hypothetical protein
MTFKLELEFNEKASNSKSSHVLKKIFFFLKSICSAPHRIMALALTLAFKSLSWAVTKGDVTLRIHKTCIMTF